MYWQQKQINLFGRKLQGIFCYTMGRTIGQEEIFMYKEVIEEINKKKTNKFKYIFIFLGCYVLLVLCILWGGV